MTRPAPYISFLLLALLCSCSALKYVPKDESLYGGADVEVLTPGKVKDQGKAISEVKDLLRPKRNTTILGSRPLLWVYYVAGTPKKEKGLRHWLKNKVGQPPVYISMTDPTLVSRAIDAKLYNMGFFNAYSQPEIVEKKKGKVSKIVYQLFMTEPYLVQEVVYPKATDSLSRNIALSKKRSLIKPGDRYDLDVLVQERIRIDERLKRHGFYYFNPEYILYRTDTSLGNGRLRLYTDLKRETPDKAKMMYRIADVNVYPDYKLGDTLFKHMEVIDTVNYYDETHYIRPEPVIRAIFLRNNQLYNRRKHNLTLNRLNGLGVFKFVNVRITDKDTSVPGWLTTNIFLSPLPKKSLSLEVEGVSKSNNFIGPALTLSLRNRNAFKGAELFIYNVRTSFETQFNGLYKGRFTYEINPRIELYVPRFMVPFRLPAVSNFVPRTKYIIDYSYLSRVGYFDMQSFKFTYGYKWKQKITVDHDLSVVSVNYFNIYNMSPSFTELIRQNVLLRRRFEEQFIAGSAYSYTYNGQVKHRNKNQFYFNGNAEAAGNTIALYKKVVEGESATAGNPSKVLGINFAQFVRADVDVRDYIRLSEKTMIATRFIAGWGLPYGNSSTMPYIKQFFSGGAYSVRGFQAYSIGPGSYRPPDSLNNMFFLQQGGEIKLEGNIEYRFPIVSVLRGAFFADAGNVWLNKPNPEIPGAAFDKNRFYKEIAVGVGFGLRVDLNFFVLRFDLGIAARKPSLPEGQRWVLDDFDLSSTQWRRQNLVFNIAFGYPF